MTAASKSDTLARLRKYVGQWSRWINIGLTTIGEFEQCVQTLLPSIFYVGYGALRVYRWMIVAKFYFDLK